MLWIQFNGDFSWLFYSFHSLQIVLNKEYAI